MSETKEAVVVRPFAIEARTPRNQDLMIQNLGNARLRGAVSASVEVYDKTWREDDDDEMATHPTGAKLIDGVGELPGMQLYVDPSKCEWKVRDPLHKDEKLLDRITRAVRRATGIAVAGQRMKGLPPREGKLGQDEMKTLCAELLCFIEANEARVVKGSAPSKEELDELPGRYLLNWSNIGQWRQPRYADQYDDWVNRMGQISGGE